MQINVVAFGMLKDITGAASLRLSDVLDTNAVVKEMNRMFPSLIDSKYLIAVEKEIVNENTILKDNYTVALLPPYSGG
jgi:molybdopterin converting factor small subunit